jgi:hypothetical protein
MVMRPTPGRNGGWRVEIGKGPSAFGRDDFADAAAAEAWAGMAAQALKACTIRLGTKRIVATPAEALRRWAIDQGTLPLAEGGTHVAPVERLAGLMADPACALPLAAIVPGDLAALRLRRRAVLGNEAAMLVEQAALAAAIGSLLDLYLPGLAQPCFSAAPDGLQVLEDAACAQAIALALSRDADLGRAVALMLTAGLAPAALLAARLRDAGPGGLPWPDGLPRPLGAMDAPLLGPMTAATLAESIGAVGAAMGHPGLLPATLWLAGLTVALRDGRHLDEALALAGLHAPAAMGGAACP